MCIRDSSTDRGARVRIRFGESVMEAMSEPGGEGNATNDHARRDIRTEIGMMSMNRIGETGFRFVRIDLEEENASLSLKSIAAVLVYNCLLYTSCDMYHRYEEDLDLAKRMNLDSFRFSFSWSRILPEGKGKVSQKGIDFYKRLIDGMRKRDLIPNATIYHWDLPYELERLGGWLNRDVADWYGEYASILYREFGDTVPLWATVNEPIATYVGYALGGFAPGFKLEKYGRQANHHILLAHGEGIRRFRQENLKDSKAGIVVDVWQHYPCLLYTSRCV